MEPEADLRIGDPGERVRGARPGLEERQVGLVGERPEVAVGPGGLGAFILDPREVRLGVRPVVARSPHCDLLGERVPVEPPVAVRRGAVRCICPAEHTTGDASTSHESSGMTPAAAISAGRRPSGAA